VPGYWGAGRSDSGSGEVAPMARVWDLQLLERRARFCDSLVSFSLSAVSCWRCGGDCGAEASFLMDTSLHCAHWARVEGGTGRGVVQLRLHVCVIKWYY